MEFTTAIKLDVLVCSLAAGEDFALARVYRRVAGRLDSSLAYEHTIVGPRTKPREHRCEYNTRRGSSQYYTNLQQLKNSKKVLFQPIFKIPQQKMLVGHIWMCQELVAKISVKVDINFIDFSREYRVHLSFRSGAPPPIHQSTTARNAFKLSSRPFFEAIALRLSSARTLCTGEPCTMSVKAESRSDNVPDARTRVKKRASAEEVVCDDDSVYAVASCVRRVDARVDLEDRNSEEGVGSDFAEVRGGRVRYHCEVGCTILTRRIRSLGQDAK